ncbi:MAG: class I SAM-dependent methyltransferase, partial [Dehalococcoidia bacterium]|nr:class I SAM-dependent methyltransferase [Dehalococcoidia bacterium]
HSLRSAWDHVRPFPLPRYDAATPRVGAGDPLDPFLPPTASTLAAAAMSEEAAGFVDGVLDRLTPSDELTAGRFFYRSSRAKFGRHWRHADLLTTLWAAATLIRPRSYLEIGVWRGRSAAVVASAAPRCAVYGFDLWIPEYAGAKNPGPDFVRQELRRVGYQGELELVSGNSRETLPAFLREHPDLYFDLITVDGDKSILGAASDMANALPRLKVGGIVVFDDLPVRPVLRRVWDRAVRRDRRYATWQFDEGRLGVATAVRME